MQTLYDSEDYSVTHIFANATAVEAPRKRKFMREGGAKAILQVPILSRDVFEIVDKHSNKAIALDGAWAELFRGHIESWRAATPTQEEVEYTLEGFTQLAQNPVNLH